MQRYINKYMITLCDRIMQDANQVLLLDTMSLCIHIHINIHVHTYAVHAYVCMNYKSVYVCIDTHTYKTGYLTCILL